MQLSILHSLRKQSLYKFRLKTKSIPKSINIIKRSIIRNIIRSTIIITTVRTIVIPMKDKLLLKKSQQKRKKAVKFQENLKRYNLDRVRTQMILKLRTFLTLKIMRIKRYYKALLTQKRNSVQKWELQKK